jgi:predicted amidohydrolase YtcJ
MTDTVLQNVRPWASQATDLVVRDGRLVDGPPDAGADMIDGGGRIALPGLVDAHGHIDKTLLGTGWHSHRGGPTVLDRIRNERNVLAEMNLSPAVQAARVIDRMAARGTTHCRTHVDIAPDSGLSCFLCPGISTSAFIKVANDCSGMLSASYISAFSKYISGSWGFNREALSKCFIADSVFPSALLLVAIL